MVSSADENPDRDSDQFRTLKGAEEKIALHFVDCLSRNVHAHLTASDRFIRFPAIDANKEMAGA